MSTEKPKKIFGKTTTEGLQKYRVTMLIKLDPGAAKWILPCIEEGMDFGEGEEILEYECCAITQDP